MGDQRRQPRWAGHRALPKHPGEGISFQRGAAVPHDNSIVNNDVVGAANWVDSQLSVSGYNGCSTFSTRRSSFITRRDQVFHNTW
jgi:hypothetical protein